MYTIQSAMQYFYVLADYFLYWSYTAFLKLKHIEAIN